MNLIIGAGITGLSFASFLKNEDYLILEASDSIGGYCKSIKQDGFVWDYSGHFFHFRNHWIKDYLLERMDVSLIKDCTKETQIYYNDRFIDFPFQKNIHQLEKEDFIDCLYDLFNPTVGNQLTFKDMLYNEFGKSIAEKFLVPYNEKLYACDLDLLDKDSMGRFFPHANKEQIISNFRNNDSSSYNDNFTYPSGGAIEYVKSLASRCDSEKISLNEKLISIDLKSKTAITNKRKIKYNNLISTIPLPSLLNYAQINYKRKIYSWNKVLVFNLGFDKKGLDCKNHWIYFPDKSIRFYRIGYYDNIFSSDRMSLYVEIGFSNNDEINVEVELKRVLEDLGKTGIKANNQNLISSAYVIMDPAYVHISKESEFDVINKKAMLKQYNVHSIGRYGSWTYCSIEDNIIEAQTLAHILNEKQ
jgi:protoporphyrinogen oxidase